MKFAPDINYSLLFMGRDVLGQHVHFLIKYSCKMTIADKMGNM